MPRVWKHVAESSHTDGPNPENDGPALSIRQECKRKYKTKAQYEDVNWRQEAPNWPDCKSQENREADAAKGQNWHKSWYLFNICF